MIIKRFFTLLLFFAVFSTIAKAQGDTETSARKYFADGNYTESTKLFNIAAKMAQNSGNTAKMTEMNKFVEKSRSAESNKTNAEKANKAGNKASAYNYFKEVLRINPNDPTAKAFVSQYEKEKKANKSSSNSNTPKTSVGSTNNNKSNTGTHTTQSTGTKSNTKSTQQTNNTKYRTSNNTTTTETQNKKSVDNERQRTDERLKNRRLGMSCYNRKDYFGAVEYFELSGTEEELPTAERNAYNYSKMEVAYQRLPQRFMLEADRNSGLAFISKYPSSNYVPNVKRRLMNYYRDTKNYNAAYSYAQTEAERSVIAKAKMAADKQAKKDAKARKRKEAEAKSIFHPKFGINFEVGPIGKVNELALPLDVRLFGRDAMFDVAIGARFAYRKTFTSTMFDEHRAIIATSKDGVAYNKATFSYEQLSAYTQVQFNTGITPSEMNLYIAVGARVNYNFDLNFTISERPNTLSEWTDEKVSAENILVPITTTLRTQLGYGCKHMEIYLYYDYDFVPAINLLHPNIEYSDNNAIEYMLQMSKQMNNRHFYGAGLRIFL